MQRSHLIHYHNIWQVNKNVNTDKLILLSGGDIPHLGLDSITFSVGLYSTYKSQKYH